MEDISFYTNEGRFNFRVAAYVTCGDKMLIEHTDGVDFANLIGGRVQLGENTIDAIKREMKEEIGVDVKKQKLILIAENFFQWQGKKVHEMLFVYQVELAKKYLKQLDRFNILDHDNQHVEWVEKSKIKNYICKPDIIYQLPKFENNNFITHKIGK